MRAGWFVTDRVHILEDRSLVLENVNINDEGEYSCEADNVVGSASAIGSLVIHCKYFIGNLIAFRILKSIFAILAMPKFVIRPTAQTVDFNSDASFECQASGFPRPTLFWSMEGNRSIILPGTTSGNFNATSSVEGLSVLTLTQVQRSDSGMVIICSAVNTVGAITARAKLSISSQDDRPPPVSNTILSM